MLTGLLGRLLAASLVIQCTVTGFQPHPTLNCNDEQQSVLVIPYSEWPTVWHGPEMGFAYEILVTAQTADSLEGEPLPSRRDEGKLAEEARRARDQQRRWHQNRNIREGREP